MDFTQTNVSNFGKTKNKCKCQQKLTHISLVVCVDPALQKQTHSISVAARSGKVESS